MKHYTHNSTRLYPIHVYKQPLKPYEGGHGFVGVVLQTEDGTKLQCHVCGGLFRSLASHIQLAHEITAKEYRKKFSLMHNTALVSDVERVVRVDRMNDMRSKLDFLPDFRKGVDAAAKATRGKPYKMSLEVKNVRGSCLDQIVDKIKQFHADHGKTPTRYEFEDAYAWGKRYVRLAERTFGSWSKALKKAGLEMRTQENHGHQGKRWSDDEILELITLFRREEGREPSFSDFRRGYLPHPATVTRRFGSLDHARALADATF